MNSYFNTYLKSLSIPINNNYYKNRLTSYIYFKLVGYLLIIINYLITLYSY